MKGWPTAVLVVAFQIIRVPSNEPDAMYCASGENVTDVTPLVWPCIGSPIGSPDFMSHTITVLSYDPDTSCVPSGENTTAETALECPWKGAPTGAPNLASQNLTVPSSAPEAMTWQSGENATHHSIEPTARSQSSESHFSVGFLMTF